MVAASWLMNRLRSADSRKTSSFSTASAAMWCVASGTSIRSGLGIHRE